MIVIKKLDIYYNHGPHQHASSHKHIGVSACPCITANSVCTLVNLHVDERCSLQIERWADGLRLSAFQF